MIRRLLRCLAGIIAAGLFLSGCSFDVYDLPLPGGADTGDNPITLTVQFADVLDLVPDSSVKVGDVTVGKVDKIRLDKGHADVALTIRKDTKLPVNAIATIRQTSLLGEKFVDLAAPASDPSPTLLKSGDTITLANSGKNPEIEEVLGALSLVLNGGGVAQLQTISVELNKALAGHEDAARDVLVQANEFATQLDTHKDDIVHAIDALDRLAKSARGQEATIDATLEQLPAALTSINGQRKDLVTMLQSLAALGDVGTRVIKASKDQVIRTFDNLQPTLTQLAAAGDHLVNAVDTIFTYPFVDEVVGRDPTVARNLHMGDYVNLSIDLQVDLSSLDLNSAVPSIINPTNVVSNLTKCLQSGSLSSQACKDLIATPGALLNLLNECKKPANRNTSLCKGLNQLPGLPNLTGTTGGILPSSVASQLNSALPGLGDALTSGLGLLRAAPGATSDGKTLTGSFTYDELSSAYDPSLVRLLVPGLAVKGAAK
ncbi:MCE family protein [Nocardioides sp. Kera G14]|uniref:MCE family protein n=1 Tax=Nocardioides sp. Kera G14 TaxID=2884264 RepID=UPI001D122C26|nr:MCE family protein [Nocardioides sp. Kera G14]UDY23974.1 MCE family protein [Nocardioides sp. Kera G14]